MATINLKEYYPFYDCDLFIEIDDDLAQQLKQWERDEQTLQRKRLRHRAYFSLDVGNGIENDITFISCTPDELYERKITREQLHQAIAALPDKQGKRIYARFFLGMSYACIAKAEGVRMDSVKESVARGLRRIGKFLKTCF